MGCLQRSHERVSDGELVLIFDTAWSSPEPIFAKIAAECADISASIVAFDEGWNFAFTGLIGSGYYLGHNLEATDELYERVYGEAPEREDEEA